MVADPLIEPDRLLRDHPQALFDSGKRHAGLGMDVDGAVDVRTALEHAAVQREARPVDARRSSRSSFMSTLPRLEAVTSVHSSSCCFIRNLLGSPGTRIAQ